MSALQLVSTLRPSGFACKLFRFLSFGTCPVAHDEPLPAALGFCALGKVARRLAEMQRRRRPQGGGGLTSGGVSLILPRSARVEAAGFEPASASAPSVRFYEHSSRFSFTFRDGPGRRREASPLSVPSALRARTLGVSPLNDTGNRAVGRPDRWASLFKQRLPAQHLCRRVSCAAGVLRVSSKLGSSHRTLTAPVEAYAPPCTANILPFWREF
jgi:hypothetical protein